MMYLATSAASIFVQTYILIKTPTDAAFRSKVGIRTDRAEPPRHLPLACVLRVLHRYSKITNATMEIRAVALHIWIMRTAVIKKRPNMTLFRSILSELPGLKVFRNTTDDSQKGRQRGI